LGNDYAEHAALAGGVSECADRNQPQRIRLHVIWDSRLVPHHTIEVKTRSLRGISNLTVQALSQYPHLTLSHTLSASSTMANNLAKLAMDDQHSTDTSTIWTPIDAHLYSPLPSDTAFALTPITHRPFSDLFHGLAPIFACERQKSPVWVTLTRESRWVA
jgi:hypothetical protein